MDELESQLLCRCREMRAGAERILIGVESGLFKPRYRERLRQLAESTLRAVDQYERGYEREQKNPPDFPPVG